MGKGHRSERLGGEIMRITSDLLLRELKDPRLADAMVSITDVDVTSDGSYATVYICVMGSLSDEDKAEKEADVLAALSSAKGLIKREIGKRVKLRHVPELIFKIDRSMDYGRHMTEVIDSLGIENYPDREKEDDEI